MTNQDHPDPARDDDAASRASTDGPASTAPGDDDRGDHDHGEDDHDHGEDGDDGGDQAPVQARRQAPGRQAAPPRRTGVFIDPRDLRGHVGDLLRSIVGEHRVDPFGNFTFDHDDARIFITVSGSPVGPQVSVFSVTNADLDLSPELATWMATTNHQLGLGTLSYDSDNRAVWLRHNLLGTHLDAPELATTLQAIATTAATVDDKINQQFGGRMFDQAAAAHSEADAGTAGDWVPEDGGDGDPPMNTTGYL